MLRVAIEATVVVALVVLSCQVYLLNQRVDNLPATTVVTQRVIEQGRATPPLLDETKAHFWANQHIEQELKLIELKTRCEKC